MVLRIQNVRKKIRLDGPTSVWDYDGVVKKAILALMFKYAREVGKELSEHLISVLHSSEY